MPSSDLKAQVLIDQAVTEIEGVAGDHDVERVAIFKAHAATLRALAAEIPGTPPNSFEGV